MPLFDQPYCMPPEAQYFGLDTSSVKRETVPLFLTPARPLALTRVYDPA